MPNQPIELPSSAPKEVTAALSLIPYRRDDLRAKYLGWMCSGFSDEEALFVLGLNVNWLEIVRKDEKFCELEARIPELRTELSKEYTSMDFLRNFRMVLEKDHRVLRMSLGLELEEDEETGDMVPVQMSPYDHQYLLKLRTAYTPQQLQLMEEVVSGKTPGFNFAQWVSENKDTIQNRAVELKRTTETITLADGQNA